MYFFKVCDSLVLIATFLCFSLPLFENGFALFYLLLNPFGVLFKLVWKNGDGADIP